MELFDYGWADDYDSNRDGPCDHGGVAAVSGIPAVERLIFDDRPVIHNLAGPSRRRAGANALALSFYILETNY